MARTAPGQLVRRRGDGTSDSFQLRQDVTTLGRSESCAIVVPSPTVSRLHARIELQHDRYVLFDDSSANGTFVNGQSIVGSRQLNSGDEIWLGSREASFVFNDPDETQVALPSVQPDPLTIDGSARVVRVYGGPVQLSPLEYDLLLHLAQHPGTVCTREGSYLAVWGHIYDQATCEDAFNACIAKLRRNLRAAAEQAGHEPPVITTIQRVGFRLDTPVVFTSRAEEGAATRQLTR